MSALRSVLLFSGAWALFGVASGLIGSRIPLRWLRRDRGPLRLHRFEAGGGWYRRHLRIGRWKDRLPEAGDLFGQGISKARLRSASPDALRRFAAETRRAEWVHWANVLFGASFLLWTPLDVGLFMLAFGVVVHTPFLVIQRYNRARLVRLRRYGPEPERPRRRRRVALAVVLVGSLGAAVYLIAFRPAPARQVTVAEARARSLRDGAAGRTTSGLPREGVYLYAGTGTEHLDKPPVSQGQGPEMPGTVTYSGGGCWSFRIDYSTKHAQTWDYCRRGSSVIEVGGRTDQRLDIVVTELPVRSTTVCEPGTVLLAGERRAGSKVRQRCTAHTSANDEVVHVVGDAWFVGEETLEVGDRPVKTCHYRHERNMTGGQSGWEHLDLWLDCATGLPIRNARSVLGRTGTPIGEVTYTEKGTFTLQSTAPVTG